MSPTCEPQTSDLRSPRGTQANTTTLVCGFLYVCSESQRIVGVNVPVVLCIEGEFILSL